MPNAFGEEGEIPACAGGKFFPTHQGTQAKGEFGGPEAFAIFLLRGASSPEVRCFRKKWQERSASLCLCPVTHLPVSI